ncbi:MAG: DUF1013 domain-containing protein [Rickettsiales bacterium]|jgi:hypothetical protein|nr:DUF1013 domain-containing protein [Rickettsiales bacterium]
MKKAPLNKKAIAIWLVENTSLTFEQIADFCQMNIFEIQAIADGEVDDIIGQSPITLNQLTRENIDECEKDSTKSLELVETVDISELDKSKKKKKVYIPISRRNDKPNAIAFLLKYYPEMPTIEIRKLIGTTKNMIDAIKDKTYWNIKDVSPQNPVLLGLCSKVKFDELLDNIKKNSQ